MPTNNLILFIIRRGKKLLLIKQDTKEALWSLPGGRIVLKYGFTHAGYLYLRPYFRDLRILRVNYLRRPVEDIKYADAYRRVILIGCEMRSTVRKEMRSKVWFTEPESLLHHIVVPGTIELLHVPEILRHLM